MIENDSGLSKPCQFPFTLLNHTFTGCTTIIDKHQDTGKYVHGELWCSTRTDHSNNHIPRKGFYGECVNIACPKEDEGTRGKSLLELLNCWLPLFFPSDNYP